MIHATRVLISVLIFWSLSPAVMAIEQQPSEIEFRRSIERSIAITWADMPIAQGLRSLSQDSQLAIFLDRRVDPDLMITTDIPLQPFVDALRNAIKSEGLDVGFVGSVVYVGPKQTCARLATLVEIRETMIRDIPAIEKRLSERREMDWSGIVEPRSIASQWAIAYGLDFPGLETLPHDQWRGTDLPPLTFVEGMTLLTSGFGFSFRVEPPAQPGKTYAIRLTRFPSGVSVTRTYDFPRTTAEEILDQFPHADVQFDANKLVVRALVEDHWEISRKWGQDGVVQAPAKSAAEATRVYSLTIENQPVGKLMDLLGPRLGYTIEFDPEAGSYRDKRVTFSVKQATVHELLENVLTPAGLKFRLEGKRVVVFPAIAAP